MSLHLLAVISVIALLVGVVIGVLLMAWDMFEGNWAAMAVTVLVLILIAAATWGFVYLDNEKPPKQQQAEAPQ